TVTPGAWAGHAERLKHAVGMLPVIASTRLGTLEVAERVLAAGQADFVSLARPFLAEPALVAKARAGKIGRINPCIACNQACIDRSLRDLSVSCMVNPRAGREWEWPEPAAQGARRRFAVIGGGPAGLEAARTLAVAGASVVLYEAQPELGGQFRLAARIPDKEDFAGTIAYFARELDRLGAEVRLQARIGPESAGELEDYEGIVVATGVMPRAIDLPGSELPLVRTYPEALLRPDGGNGRIAVIGAGGIGVDVAHLYSQRGRPVTLMCRGKVVGEHLGRSTRWVILKAMRERGVETLTGVSYERISAAGVAIRDREGRERLIEAAVVVVAAGQESADPLSAALSPSKTLERRGRPVHVVGGARATGGLDAVRAFREGAEAARALLADGAGSTLRSTRSDGPSGRGK
ncbi:MAG: FAD-dependent oxidoreductase, partial [Steroidobacteraceae bacterium]